METGSQLSIDAEVLPEPLANESGDPTFSSSTSTDVMPQQPVKKATRQWAAWTHEEEENFFNALRQVGKNFDKITWRVQSKNKDQVRHYYYRLVRRMNKLLGPGLCLDAKNSKDTIAAMLRWWSLLEKYSCKASKLHLKPRRFKIFIEALELQLLKDRKKNINRRLLLGGNCLPTAPGTISNQRRLSGNDVRSVKLVFVDSSNILGPRRASLKRNPNMGVNCSNKKGESDTVKSLRQRRKAGPTSAAAYKKWEEAAIAGVSLVADAAAHLEETTIIREIKNGQNIPGRKYSSDDQNDLPSSHNLPKTHYMVDSNGTNPAKLKLQLFPIDDGTRRALEMDKHNPYLELTLSSKKRISSVLDHLNKKWGDSSIAVGELMLFPYSTLDENSIEYHRWAHDSLLSAADVYTILGSPQVFRLRYGWFSFGISSTSMQANMESGYTLGESNNSNTNVNRANKDDQDDLRGIGLSACEWADSLMNNSVGDVLSGVARDVVDDCMDAPVSESPCCMHQVPFCSDSFDAAIAAYISHQQDKTAPKPTLASNISSIWDGEETCDAFSFKKDSVLWEDGTGISAVTSLDSSKQFPRSSPELVEHLPGVVVEAKNEFLSDRSVLDTTAKDFNGLANMYWPDSLGPLDLDIQSSKYHNEHLILSDSLSGLNQLIASSLDAFQNCSFFGFDKKEASSTVETRQIGAFSDVKVSSEA